MSVCHISIIHAIFNKTFGENVQTKCTDKMTNITVINVLHFTKSQSIQKTV